MKTLNLIQDSPEWHAHRDNPAVLNASEASSMMGAHKKVSRTDLIRAMAIGDKREVGAYLQKVFDNGHEVEALARPIAEEYIGEDLSPVTGVQEVDGLTLSASFDGITFDHETTWECKQWNIEKAEYMRDTAQVPTEDYWQVVQQLVVSGAKRTIYTLSDGTPERTIHVTMSLKEADQKRLLAGWRQLLEDVANYQHVESKPEAVAAPIEALPALLVQVEGRVVATNMDAFKAKANEFIANIKTDLQTDQDFADADKMAKFLGDGEKQLDAVKAQAQAQAASIDEVFRTIDAVKEQMRTTRLKLEKLVKTEKENRKGEIVSEAQTALMEHRAKLAQRLGGDFLPPIAAGQFAEAIKGLKSLDSMRDKVSTVLANLKIEASEIADRIIDNQKVLNDVDDIYVSLFEHDLKATLLKERDDFKAVVFARVEEHKQRLEAERERIRQDEEAKAQREAAAKVQQQNTPPEGKDGTPAVARPEPAASVTATKPETASPDQAVMDAEADIRAFLEAKVPATKRNAARAVLVEWIKWNAAVVDASMEEAA